MGSRAKRIVIGILSGDGHADRRERCRATWVADLAGRPDVAFAFVVGNGRSATPERDGDVLRVDCADDYDSLPQKTRALAEWALAEHAFDHLFKCDDDTYACVPRLLGLDLLGREYVGSRCGTYAQGGAGYFLSRRATALVAEGLRRFPSGPEDLLVGRVLAGHGLPLSADWRFRPTREPEHRPAPGNEIVTCHGCRGDDMTVIHAAMAAAPTPAAPTGPFTVVGWAADYGMLGLGGELGFWTDGKSRVEVPPHGPGGDLGPGCEFISAHASSRVDIEVRRPVRVLGFMDAATRDRPSSPVAFSADGERLGRLHSVAGRTRSTVLGTGRHRLEARCLNPNDNGHRYSIWAVRPERNG